MQQGGCSIQRLMVSVGSAAHSVSQTATVADLLCIFLSFLVMFLQIYGHKCSIAFTSGEFLGHNILWMCMTSKKHWFFSALCAGASSSIIETSQPSSHISLTKESSFPLRISHWCQYQSMPPARLSSHFKSLDWNWECFLQHFLFLTAYNNCCIFDINLSLFCLKLSLLLRYFGSISLIQILLSCLLLSFSLTIIDMAQPCRKYWLLAGEYIVNRV